MIKWFSVIDNPPPFSTQLLTKGIDSGSFYKWNFETNSKDTHLTEYAHLYFDLGTFLPLEGNNDQDRDESYPYYYDSSSISADKNSYEIWNEVKPPIYWAYLEDKN